MALIATIFRHTHWFPFILCYGFNGIKRNKGGRPYGNLHNPAHFGG